VTKLEVESRRATSDDRGHDDGDGEKGDPGQPGKGRGGSRSNRGARASNQYKPAIYLVLICLSILDSQFSAISYRAHHSHCMAQE